MAVARREPGAEFAAVLGEISAMGEDERCRPILTRTLRAVEEVLAALPGSALNMAVAASSDLEVLLALLLSNEVLARFSASDPLAGAKLRGLQARISLMSQEGGMWSTQQAANHVGVTRQAIDKRIRAGKLLAIDAGRHGRLVPAWQFGDRGALPGLEETLKALEAHDPWMNLTFFLSPHVGLDGIRPLDFLRERRGLDLVLRAARTLGEHGAT